MEKKSTKQLKFSLWEFYLIRERFCITSVTAQVSCVAIKLRIVQRKRMLTCPMQLELVCGFTDTRFLLSRCWLLNHDVKTFSNVQKQILNYCSSCKEAWIVLIWKFRGKSNLIKKVKTFCVKSDQLRNMKLKNSATQNDTKITFMNTIRW